MVSNTGKFAFASHNFTLAVASASYTITVLKCKGEPSFLVNCFAGAILSTPASSTTSLRLHKDPSG